MARVPANRKSVGKNLKRSSSLTKTEEPKTSKFSRFPVKLNRIQALTLIGALVIIGLLYNFKSLFIVATVNGEPISRIALIKELEKQSGKATLNSLVTKTLIFQEAKKQNITITDAEVNKELKNIEDTLAGRGQKLDELLTLQGTTKQEFVEQIKTQKLVEKMIGKDIKVTDQEVDDYIEKNKEFIDDGASPQDLKKNVRQQLEQQKLGEKFQKWLSDLQKNAKINYFVNY